MDKAPAILLVEDEPLIGASIEADLHEGGYSIIFVTSGAEALDVLHGNDPVSGLITDIRLGDGADGWEVARRARELNHQIPVVYISGDSASDHPVHGVPESVMIQKPFASAQLMTAISSLLNSAAPKE